jgi:D-sedoheptulose 7-phosphate isomerase
MNPILATIAAHREVIDGLAPLAPAIHRLADQCNTAIQAGGRILWAGNGGSAADCQHLAAELVGRFEAERRALPAIALTTDTSVLTAVANDYGFESVFARQVAAIGRKGDVLIALSTSGNSNNILSALRTAADLGIYCVLWSGETGGACVAHANLCLNVPSTNTARIQEAHILIGHILCSLIEGADTARRQPFQPYAMPSNTPA